MSVCPGTLARAIRGLPARGDPQIVGIPPASETAYRAFQ
jgi:hypothetical protein